jgi:Fic family protein
MEQTAKHSIEILNDILNLEKNLTQTIRENTGNRANNNLRLLEKLFQMPFIKVEDVREQLEVSSATAKNIVDDLVRVNCLMTSVNDTLTYCSKCPLSSARL